MNWFEVPLFGYTFYMLALVPVTGVVLWVAWRWTR